MRKWLLLMVLICWPAGPAAWAQEAGNAAEAEVPADEPAAAAANTTPDAAPPAAAEAPAEPVPVDPVAAARGRALAALEQGDTIAARSAWDELLKLAPPAWEAVAGKGACALLEGDTPTAEAEFLRALSAEPANSELPALVARAYQLAGRCETACAYYRRALSIEPRSDYRARLAACLIELKQLDEARPEIDAILAEQPANPDYIKLAGDLALAGGDAHAAIEHYRKAALAGQALEHQLALAELLTAQKSALAEAAWDDLVKNYAAEPAAWLKRAAHYRDIKKTPAAVADIKKALELDPASQAAYLLWGDVLSAAGDQDSAAAQYAVALKLGPTPELYLALLAALAADPVLTPQREQVWTEFLAAFPDHPEALLANGHRLYAAGSFQAAAEVFARGALAAPADARFPKNEGDCRLRLSDFEGAVVLYEHALKLAYDPQVVISLATALTLAGREEEAAQHWRRCLREHGDDAELAMQYGLFLYEHSDLQGALEQYQRGQWLDPDNDVFYNRAGICLYQLGQADKAIEQVRTAIRLRPDPQYYLNLAAAQASLDQAEEAAAAYREGLAQFPDDRELLRSFADYLISRREYEPAQEILRALAEQEPSAEIYGRLARLAEASGDDGQADAAYLQALALDPRDQLLRIDYALLLARLNRTRELLAHFADTRDAAGQSAANAVLDEVGGYWIEFEQYERAIDFMEQVIAFDSSLTAAYNTLAMCHQILGDTQAALTAVKRGLNDAGDSYLGRYLEVLLTYRGFGADAARPLAEQLIKHPYADADAYALYLELVAYDDDPAEQARVARAGLELNPDSAELFGYLALALYDSGDYAGVVALMNDRHYQRIDWWPRHELLGLSYLATGNYVRSAADLATAAKDSDRAELWAALGEAQYFMPDYAAARKSLTTSLGLEPANATALTWLGLTLLAQGDLTGAQASFDSAGEASYLPEVASAWLMVGRAKLALERGDIQTAQKLLTTAQMYDLGLARFDAELQAARQAAGL
ncbi:tetratricopeptide repeat protein [bacterium]|nr:tetratricopeptide repeat protein [bacterium]